MPWSPQARSLGWGCLLYTIANLALLAYVTIRNAYRPWPWP